MALSGIEGTSSDEAAREYHRALEALEFTRSLAGDETANRERLEQAIANLRETGVIDFSEAKRYQSWAGLHMPQVRV